MVLLFFQYKDIKKMCGHTVTVPDPNYIFEVTPSALADEKFERLRAGRELLYAFHGSRLENFFSILNNGLASHMNKVHLHEWLLVKSFFVNTLNLKH